MDGWNFSCVVFAPFGHFLVSMDTSSPMPLTNLFDMVWIFDPPIARLQKWGCHMGMFVAYLCWWGPFNYSCHIQSAVAQNKRCGMKSTRVSLNNQTAGMKQFRVHLLCWVLSTKGCISHSDLVVLRLLNPFSTAQETGRNMTHLPYPFESRIFKLVKQTDRRLYLLDKGCNFCLMHQFNTQALFI